MGILTTIPISLNGVGAIAPLLENVRQQIALRAHENFVERGAVYGHDLDDWLDDQREEGKDVFVRVILPKIGFAKVAVHVAPRQFVISSDPDEDGRQLSKVIDLPVEISLASVDAEQLDNVIHISAGVASDDYVSPAMIELLRRTRICVVTKHSHWSN